MDHTSKDEAQLFATQLVTASALQAALKAAVELDILELIKKAGPGALLSPAELVAKIPNTNPEVLDMLDRILRLLSANSVLNCSLKSLPDGHVERMYSLAPVCEFLTKNEDGVSLAPLLLLNEDTVLKSSWDKICETVVQGGIPFNNAHGMSGFEYGARDPRFLKLFDEAMSNQSTLIMKSILETYHGFEGLKSMVDVGGGVGTSLSIITSKYPSIKGINFDLAHVVQRAPSYAGVEHVGGDMFVSVPKADAVFMKWISHNWSDERCLKLFKNCYEAIPENGKVVLVDLVMSEAQDNGLAMRTALNFDMVMFAHTPGGKERTEREFRALAKVAGFRDFHKVCCAYSHWIMELIK